MMPARRWWGSSHEFHRTPEHAELIYRLRKMQDMGADILKVAVMPQNKADVLTLLSATEEMYRLYAQRPLLTMSMASDGVISRLCGEVFGSAATFGMVGQGSAPARSRRISWNRCWRFSTERCEV